MFRAVTKGTKEKGGGRRVVVGTHLHVCKRRTGNDDDAGGPAEEVEGGGEAGKVERGHREGGCRSVRATQATASGKRIDWNDLGHFNEKSSGTKIHKYVGSDHMSGSHTAVSYASASSGRAGRAHSGPHALRSARGCGGFRQLLG